MLERCAGLLADDARRAEMGETGAGVGASGGGAGDWGDGGLLVKLGGERGMIEARTKEKWLRSCPQPFAIRFGRMISGDPPPPAAMEAASTAMPPPWKPPPPLMPPPMPPPLVALPRHATAGPPKLLQLARNSMRAGRGT